MTTALVTSLNPRLPKLAWLATVDLDTGLAEVMHGASVECGADFVVEGVWEGRFEDARFHKAEHFFGSGIVRDAQGWWLVPSRALVDRLLYCQRGQSILASNSLPLLLAYTGATLDPAWDYRRESYTILNGLSTYEPAFRVLHPEIESFYQAFYHPLLISPGGIHAYHEQPLRRFSSYGEYVTALREALAAIEGNARSDRRLHRVDAYATISRGYDSPAVAVLARHLGIRAVFTSRRSNSVFPKWLNRGAAIDDGTAIAKRLGLETRYLDVGQGTIGEDELLFLSPSAADPELVFHTMAVALERECEVALVFSGFHGDKVWSIDTAGKYLGPDIRRGDTSGLNLTDIRLKAGFINVAVPFMFARSITDLVAIARGEEMRPWSVGGDYDRPIPRRLLEEVGVPRNAFGTRKKAVVQRYDYPVNRELRKAYFEWLKERRGRSPIASYMFRYTDAVWYLVARSLRALLTHIGLGRIAPAQMHLDRGYDTSHELHYWALQQVAERLWRVLQVSDSRVPGSGSAHRRRGQENGES